MLTALLSFRSHNRVLRPCTRLALANEQSCRCHRRLGAALLSSLANSEKVLPTAQKCLLQALLLIAQIVHKIAHIVTHGINGLIDGVFNAVADFRVVEHILRSCNYSHTCC